MPAPLPVTVVAYVRAKPGQEAALKQALLTLPEPSRRDLGCVSYDVHQSQSDPARFVFYENWRSKDLLDAHLGQPHVRAVLSKAEVLLAEPPEITLWTRLS
jgi:quinol monooxygenase YgiN